MATTDPATTYTIEDFIDAGDSDEMTYRDFSIIDYRVSTEFAEQNLVDYYIDELKSASLKITSFTTEQISNYKYSPDLLAYDVYGTTSVDWIILIVNGMIDPKDFDLSKRKSILLPRSSVLQTFLSSVYNSESDWVALNRKALAASESS